MPFWAIESKECNGFGRIVIIGQWSTKSTIGSNKKCPTKLTLDTSHLIALKLNQHGHNPLSPCRFNFKATTSFKVSVFCDTDIWIRKYIVATSKRN